jgi:segregation and condensation protein B
MTEPIDVLEAVLFASDAPVEPALVQEVLDLPSADAARELVEALRRRLEEQARPLQVIEAGGGFRLVTRPEVLPWLVKLARSKTRSRLSRPALETLAIIAYRQPVSRPEVDATRGVNSEGVLDNLLERRLIRIAGRKDSPGRPFLYETTREFLVAFGLRDLGDLPKADGELIVVDPTAAEAAVAGDIADADAGGVIADGAGDTREVVMADAVASGAGDEAGAGAAAAASDNGVGPIADAMVDAGAATAGAANPDAGPRAAPADAAPAGAGDAATEDTEASSAADDSPQQDPRPGGTHVAPGC